MRMTVVPRSVLLACSLALGGCTYVTQQDWNEKTDCLDEDQDGAVRNATCQLPDVLVDCDDNNPDRAPSIEEIPYDGIDNDCDGADVVDVDGDEYPNVLEADWVSNDGVTTYPSGMNQIIDCNDNDAQIRPTAGETYYDGVDSNCDGADDWDADGDGYVIRADLIPAGGIPYDGDLPGGDCDDSDPATNPGVEDDPLADGFDRDCDGTNEYDVDGDGWMPPGTETAFLEFVDRYQYQGNFPSQFGDCDDSDPTIYEGAPDPYYDGIDSDCMGDDDFDQDGDGYVALESEWASGVTYDGTLLLGDCDDTNATVLPGVLEMLGDTVDQDCDGGADTTAFARHPEWTFVDPRPPVVGQVQGTYVMGVITGAFASLNGQTPVDDRGVLAHFQPRPPALGEPDAPPGNAATASGLVFFEPGATGSFSDQVDLEVDGTSAFLAASHIRAVNNTFRNSLRVYRVRFSGGSVLDLQSIRDGFGAETTPYSSVDLEFDGSGALSAVACTESAAEFRIGSFTNSTFTPGLRVHRDYTVDPDPNVVSVGDACFVEHRTPLASRPDPELHAFGSMQANLEIDPLDDTTIVDAGVASDLAGFTVNSVVQRDGVAALTGINPGGATPRGVTVLRDGVVTSAHLSSEEVYWASATFVGSTMYLAAVVNDRDADGQNDLVLLYGNPASPTAVDIPVLLDDEAVDVNGASIWADADRVFLAVSGVDADGNDTVAWIFVGPA